MAAIIAGPAVGGLVGAAVYYTISQTMVKETNRIRSELHTCSQILSTQSDPSLSGPSFYAPLPVSPTSLPPSPPPLSTLVAVRWNDTIRSAVHSVETTDWQVVGISLARGTNELLGKVMQAVGNLTDQAADTVVAGPTALAGAQTGLGGGTGIEAMPVLREKRPVDRI